MPGSTPSIRRGALAAAALLALAACAEPPRVEPLPLAREAYALPVEARTALVRTLARLFGPPDAPRYAALDGWLEGGFDPNAPAPCGRDAGLVAAIELDAKARHFDLLLALERGERPSTGDLPPSLAAAVTSAEPEAAVRRWQPDLVEVTPTYQSQCATCHGLTGGGDGPAAAKLDPPPRDFREGAFRYHPGGPGTVPTQADLVRIVRRGIGGSGMPLFASLGAAYQSGLADYVRFLALRGAVERAFVDRARAGRVPTDTEMDEVYAEAWGRWAILPGRGAGDEVREDGGPDRTKNDDEEQQGR